ncbi:MAG: hypothetical protein K2Y56_09430 [Methylobacterium sp.]|nr:hypothetical protein [Methylobacterium sp.]
MAQQGGYYEISDAIDGAARLVATRAITGYPMVINVTRTRDEVLKDWTREAFFGVGATALCIIAILLILWTLGRQSRANIVQAEAHLAREEAVRAREAAEAQLRQSQKMEAIGQLTGGIAHDFNNLLNVVMANLEWIERQLHNDPKLLGRVRDAISGAERAAETTHMLLAFARQQAPSAITTDVNRLIQTFARLLRTTLGGQITLTLDLAPDLPSLLVDTNQLENALLNLAVNARDAMPKGGSLTIATRVSAAEASGNEPRIVIDVTDTGPGMPPEVAAQAFDAFFTTKEVGKGTGLGLNQVLRFVRTCEGEATIASREGEGTTIRLVLPTGKPAPSSRMAA